LYEFVTDAAISVATYIEVITRLMDKETPFDAAENAVGELRLRTVDVSLTLARRAAELRNVTRLKGLSMGDRICLATAESLGAVAVTMDRAWGELSVGIPIEVVR
jgi:PIN domain nuclease of toxin-antitoxin system